MKSWGARDWLLILCPSASAQRKVTLTWNECKLKVLQPELLQEWNSNPIYLPSLICAALIISQLSQLTAVAREHPYLWRRYPFQHRGGVFAQIIQRCNLQIISSWQRCPQGWQSALTLPGTCAPYPSISCGISWPPCTAARHHAEGSVPEFRDFNRDIKDQRCTPPKEVLWSGVYQFPWAPVPTCSEPSLEEQGMEHKAAVGGNSYTERPECDTDTAKSRH